MTDPQPVAGEAVPDEIDALLAAHEGDVRAALDAVLHELRMTRVAVSRGYSRGWHHRHDERVHR